MLQLFQYLVLYLMMLPKIDNRVQDSATPGFTVLQIFTIIFFFINYYYVGVSEF